MIQDLKVSTVLFYESSTVIADDSVIMDKVFVVGFEEGLLHKNDIDVVDREELDELIFLTTAFQKRIARSR